MHKIAVHKEALVIDVPRGQLSIFRPVSGQQLIRLSDNFEDGEGRFLIAEDNKFWFWDGNMSIHYHIMAALGYDRAVTGFTVVAPGGGIGEGSDIRVRVQWDDVEQLIGGIRLTQEEMDEREKRLGRPRPANPRTCQTFMRVMSTLPLMLVNTRTGPGSGFTTEELNQLNAHLKQDA